nr:4-coumarate:CoA ligase 9 [Crinum x powellii]
MSPPPPSSPIDPRSGFNPETKTFHSLRPPTPLPPPSQPISVTSYVLSLLSDSPPPSSPAFVDSSSDLSLSFPQLASQIHSLSSSLRAHLHLSKSHVAFILSPASLQVPVLYFSLLSLGVVISPSNPLSSPSEISHQFSLSHPSVAFVTSATASKIPPHVPTVLLDSDRFRSWLCGAAAPPTGAGTSGVVAQEDPAAILYSSGTTGRVKGVVLTHRNFIAVVASYKAMQELGDDRGVGRHEGSPHVSLFTVPLFHVFGAFMVMRNVALGHTTVLMGRFGFEKMLEAVERYRVTSMPVSPPLVVAMAKSELVEKYDLSSLVVLRCGGAPLGREVAGKLKERLPTVGITQGYGLTESAGGIAGMSGPEENVVWGSAGRVGSNTEARIVDPLTGESLGPGQQGELWLRGATIMKGYVGDDQATASTLTSDGWLKTGDLCYFDHDGFLFIVDRLKELIKYKAYQVPPAELEQILQSNPEIADAAVIPYPDEEAGEIPMAFVVRQPGSSINEKQVMDFVAKQVAPNKKIRRVAFVNSIPKSAAGKILRRELINHALPKPASKL